MNRWWNTARVLKLTPTDGKRSYQARPRPFLEPEPLRGSRRGNWRLGHQVPCRRMSACATSWRNVLLGRPAPTLHCAGKLPAAKAWPSFPNEAHLHNDCGLALAELGRGAGGRESGVSYGQSKLFSNQRAALSFQTWALLMQEMNRMEAIDAIRAGRGTGPATPPGRRLQLANCAGRKKSKGQSLPARVGCAPPGPPGAPEHGQRGKTLPTAWGRATVKTMVRSGWNSTT